MEKGMAYDGLHSLVNMYPILVIFILYEIINVSDNVSAFICLHRMFPSTNILKKGSESYHGPPLYQIYILN